VPAFSRSMGELFGISVIAVSSLVLFALSTIQLAHRLADARLDPLAQTLVLPELDDVPLKVVAGFTAAIAMCSQIPVVYLLGLHGAGLSAASTVCLALEIVAAIAWMTDRAGARRAAGALVRRPTAMKLWRIGVRRRREA